MLCDIWSLADIAGLVPPAVGTAPVVAEGSVDMALLPERPPETGPGLDLVDRGAATAAGLGVPPATGYGESTSPLSPLSMAEEDARAKVYLK